MLGIQLAFGLALGMVVLQLLRAPFDSPMVLEGLMLTLILGLAVVIARFSESYLQGEARQKRYIRALACTVAFAGLVVTAPRLDELLVAWMSSSITLNVLLQHYQDRRSAQLAAHKKFLVSRSAEICLLGSCVLLARSYGTLDISEICSAVTRANKLPESAEVAIVLLGIAVILKSAQIPLHGWLMQVMEAPTPVSALLHAGVINLGGFVLLRLHPLLDRSLAAQFLLTAAGSTTLLLAGVVMMTRVSVKVRLAWSTCAQMGFLLAECGLGLYELALLHLVGHSLYKAHAFLSSGGVVADCQRHALVSTTTRTPQRNLSRHVGALVLVSSLLGIICASCRPWLPALEPASIAILCLGLAPGFGLSGRESMPIAMLRLLGLAGAYIVWHAVFSRILPGSDTRPTWISAVLIGSLFLLYCVQSAALTLFGSPLMQRLRLWAFHGFYLDEAFTRLALSVWPIRFVLHEPAKVALSSNSKEFA